MIMAGLVIVLVYIATTLVMKGAIGYNDEFLYTDQQVTNMVADYHLPSLINFEDAIAVEHMGNNQYEPSDHFHLGINLPPVIQPSFSILYVPNLYHEYIHSFSLHLLIQSYS